jgi:protein CpxP
MTTMPSIRGAALVMAVLASAPALALAQSAAAPTQSPAASTPSPGSPPADADAQVRVEGRIGQLHSQLHITSPEDAQWKAFAEIMRSNAREMDQAAAQRAEQLPTMSALQDMQSYEQLAEAHVQHLQKLIPAFENLYNAMSPDQKQIADRVFRGAAERRMQSGANAKQ